MLKTTKNKCNQHNTVGTADRTGWAQNGAFCTPQLYQIFCEMSLS